MRVALSISESGDLVSRGLSELHLLDGMTELARGLLFAGHQLAYGGDLRPGFTDALAELAQAYAVGDQKDLVMDYVPWPAAYFKKTEWKRYERVLTLRPVLPPDEVQLEGAVEGSAAFVYACARTNTRMREKMAKETEARVVLGGRTAGYAGLIPGVVEECVVSLSHRKPLFLVGAFGGAGQAVIDAIRGKKTEALSKEHLQKQPKYALLSEEYRKNGLKAELERDLQAFFEKNGVSALRNGLSRDENEELFESDEISVIVALVLRGLGRVAEGV